MKNPTNSKPETEINEPTESTMTTASMNTAPKFFVLPSAVPSMLTAAERRSAMNLTDDAAVRDLLDHLCVKSVERKSNGRIALNIMDGNSWVFVSYEAMVTALCEYSAARRRKGIDPEAIRRMIENTAPAGRGVLPGTKRGPYKKKPKPESK